MKYTYEDKIKIVEDYKKFDPSETVWKWKSDRSYKNGGLFDEVCVKYRTLYKALQIPLPESFIEGIKDFDVDEEETSEYAEPDLQIKDEGLWIKSL